MNKIQISKITLQPKVRVSKNWKPLKELIATKKWAQEKTQNWAPKNNLA